MKHKQALALFMAGMLVLLTGFTSSPDFFSESAEEAQSDFSVEENASLDQDEEVFASFGSGEEDSLFSSDPIEETLETEEDLFSQTPQLPTVGENLYDYDTGYEYEFQDSTKTSIVITGYKGSNTTLIIPKTLTMYKYPIVGIKDEAFKGNWLLTSVDLTKADILSIGTGAFQGCLNIKKALFPSCLLTIGERAFAETGLTSVEIPPSVQSIARTSFAMSVRLGGVNGGYVYRFCQQTGNPFFPICADPNRTVSFTPKVSSAEDGYEVKGLDAPIVFPVDGYHIFTVKGASAEYMYQDILLQEDGRWVPIYWLFDGSSEKHDVQTDVSKITDPVTYTLHSEEASHHTVGNHNIRIYFRLYYWNAQTSSWLSTESIDYTTVTYNIPQPTGIPTFTPTPMVTTEGTPTPVITTEGTPTPSPTQAGELTPTVTPFPTRLPFSPKVDSVASGFTVTGLDDPIELPAGKKHSFQVTGASASAVYGLELITGDTKWVPIYWTTAIGSDQHQNQVPAGTNEDVGVAQWTLQSKDGYYGRAGESIIYLYFRRYQYNEGKWSPTTEISYVPYSFYIAKITVTPTPTNTPTPSPSPTVTPTEVPIEGDIIVTPSKKTLYVGAASKYSKITLDTALGGDLEKYTVKYKSSDKTIATVSKKGVVKAVAAGKSTITAYIKVGSKTFKDKCKITVKNPTLTLSSTSINVSVGGTESFKATAKPSATIDYSSTDKSIATITNKGVITGVAPGSCDIIIKANGISKVLVVNVTED